MTITINQLYTDIDPNLKLAWNNDVAKTVGLASVRNSILGIITTTKGTRPFQPDFGCGINELLFENMNPLTSDTLNKSITSAVNTYEPRVSNINCTVNPIYDDNTIIITIYFSVIDNPDTINELKLTLESSM